MIKNKILILSTIIFSLISCIPFGIQNAQAKAKAKQTNPSSATSASGIKFGFNTKSSLNVPEQTEYAAKFLSMIPKDKVASMVIRIPGGTRSQEETSSDWSDAQIDAWTKLQRDFGVSFVFVVNGNDSPANQKAFIERWMSRGARFEFLEMMNEYYLNKFEKGESKKDVHKKVTAQKYISEILPMYVDGLNALNLPLFLILAPEKPGKAGKKMDKWNDVVMKGLERFKNAQLGVTIHLYERGMGGYDYQQIQEIRDSLPAGTPIAVTEAGVLDKSVTSPEKQGELTIQHYKKIYEQLKPGDYLFDHVLYSDYKRDLMADTHPSSKGVTPKGKAVLEFINSL
jgi:hypothetical protein